ncbi:MAG: hypothetical protein ACP5MD_08555 [Verrucomicrobiia bacterium]
MRMRNHTAPWALRGRSTNIPTANKRDLCGYLFLLTEKTGKWFFGDSRKNEKTKEDENGVAEKSVAEKSVAEK